MYEASSFTITETQKSVEVPLEEFSFQIENGNTGSMVISDPLLETLPLAQERALSEFLKNSYEIREVNFKTYRTDIKIGDIINVKGLPYKVKGIYSSINRTSIVNTIKAVRYE